MPVAPFTDYRLRGKAELKFASAGDEPCLQAADIIAGCVMRFVRSAFLRTGKRNPALGHAFAEIYDTGHPLSGTGVNLVVSDVALDRLKIPRIAAAPFVF